MAPGTASRPAAASSSNGPPLSQAQTQAIGGSASHADSRPSQPSDTAASNPGPSLTGNAKKRKHRGGKKRRNRRQSFAATSDALDTSDMTSDIRPSLADVAEQPQPRTSSSFYRLHGNFSNTSLESEALLDHRDQPTIQTRRQSVQAAHLFQSPRSSPQFAGSPQRLNPASAYNRSRLTQQQRATDSEHDDDDDADDRTPLMSSSHRDIRSGASYGGTSAPSSSGRPRRRSKSSTSSGRRRPVFARHHSQTNLDDYDVNNPPSVPASPVFEATLGLDDVMISPDMDRGRPTDQNPRSANRSRDALIDIEDGLQMPTYASNPTSPPAPADFHRRPTMLAADDVCFPQEAMSEIGHEDYMHRPEVGDPRTRRRRRRWPDLTALEEWAREEKEQRTIEGMRMRKVSEPLMVEGRLRPQKRAWHREADDVPFRFTYFNEEFENTIHSQTISELVQPGQTFRTLFIPDPPLLEDSSDDETDDEERDLLSANGHSRSGVRTPSKLTKQSSSEHSRSGTPIPQATPKPEQEKPKRYGDRPAWWLDVLSPTDAEMKTIAKAFGIHPLTAEDILMQEQREKVELFRHYYFINYRTFEQDESSEDYLEPVNLYVVVFKEGVISFHFSLTPHPANVRRRIRQLQDYLVLSPDWISYGIIDDITDAYAPLIQRIEDEVDEIDDAILRLHSVEDSPDAKKDKSWIDDTLNFEKRPGSSKEQVESGRDMLRRVGECRKKVMSLYRLLGNKADVIKGFAKRCTEQWDVAPRSEIGLYLGDIQDHIVTMTGNLSHYENILSRAHSNYLAQINIRMNERQEKTSDILGKLTVLGTIVLPMNVVTGIWGMNCLVPGQDIENLNWFWCITSGLVMFGLFCYLIAKRVYGIV